MRTVAEDALTAPDPAADHPWSLELRPDPSHEGCDGDAAAALKALDAIGGIVLAVHVDHIPSMAALVAGRSYIGWTIAVPGSVSRAAIDAIAITAAAGYRATIAPGHPLPPPSLHAVPPSEPGGDHR